MDPNQPSSPAQTPPQSDAPQPQPDPQAMPGQTAASPDMTPPTPAPQQPYNQPTYPGAPTHSYGQQPLSPYPMPPNSNGKKVLIAVVVVALIGLLGAGAVLLTRKGSDNPVSKLTNTIKGNSDVVSRSDGTLDLSTLVDKEATIKIQDLKAKLNQQVNLSDGKSYMVTSVERNFVSTSRYLKAADGKELVKISLVVGNRNKEGNSYVSGGFFKIRNSAGGLQDSEYILESDMSDAFTGEEIAPGKQVKGAIVFEVDKDEAIALATEDQYKNYTTDEEITIKSEVALK